LLLPLSDRLQRHDDRAESKQRKRREVFPHNGVLHFQKMRLSKPNEEMDLRLDVSTSTGGRGRSPDLGPEAGVTVALEWPNLTACR
jgi:hypothetical protein